MTGAETIVILFLWTNPALNVDGTVCRDFAGSYIHGVRESDSSVSEFPHPLCHVEDDGTTVCNSGPGLPDSMEVTIARREGTDWWHFNAFAYDSTGNVSDPSNTVRLDLGTGGPITGVESPPGPPGPEEWYDIHGRRIKRPTASGVYFLRQRGRPDRKVVLLK